MHTAAQAYLELLPPQLHTLYRHEQTRQGLEKDLYQVVLIFEELLQQSAHRRQEFHVKDIELLRGLLQISTGLKLDQESTPHLNALLRWIFQGTQKIQKAAASLTLPVEFATQHALASTLFAWGLLLRQASLTHLSKSEEVKENLHIGEKILAKDYLLSLMELCGGTLFNAYNRQLLHHQFIQQPSLDKAVCQTTFNQQAILLLTAGLAVICEAYGVPLTGALWKAIVEDPSFLEKPEIGHLFEDSSNFIYVLWINLQMYIATSGLEHNLMLTTMAAHCDEMANQGHQLLKPYHMLVHSSIDLQPPTGQIFA
jgi:hypothetical protein